MSDEPPAKRIMHFKKRAMGYGKRRSEGVSRATAPKANTEQPVSKSLCHIEKLAVKVRPEVEFIPPESSAEVPVTAFYKFSQIGAVEVWEDVLFRKTFSICFKPIVSALPHPEKTMVVCIMDLASRTYSEFGTYDMFMGFELHHSDLEDRICLPYMPIHTLNESILLDHLAKLRRNGRIINDLTNNEFEVTLCFVKQLTGSGERVNLKRKLDDSVNRKCLTENKVTKLCLGVAVLQGIAYLEHQEDMNDLKKEEYWNKICKADETKETSKEFLTAAEQLMVSAGVCLPDGPKMENYTIGDVEMLQDFFRGKYQIVVFADSNHKTPVFAGPSLMDKNVLPLLCTDDHFQHIVNLPLFVGSSFYCVKCNVRYNSITQHYNCPLRCRLCNGWGCMPEPDVEIVCDDCKVTFYSVACERNHRLGGLRTSQTACGSTIYCSKCETSYKKYKAHRCFEAYCQNCKVHRPKGHQCVLSKKLGGGIRAVPEKLIFVQVKCERVENDGIITEKPVIAMVFRCCISCRRLLPSHFENALEANCDTCSSGGPRVVVFERVQKENREKDVLQELWKFLLQKAHERFCVIFHDMPQCVSDDLLAYTASEGHISAKSLTLADGRLRVMNLEGINTRVVDSKYFFPVHIRELAADVAISAPLRICPQEMIKEEFFDYLGHVPDLEVFLMDCLNEGERQHVRRIHEEMKKEAYVFVTELMRCTFTELLLMAAVILTIEAISYDILGIRMMEESEDIASASILAYRRSFLTDGTLPLDIGLGAKFRTSYSLTAMYYLSWRAKKEGLPIDSTLNVGEYRVSGTPYHLDGFIQPCAKYPRGLGIDIKGCYWHAHGCSYVPKMIARRELDVPKIRAQDERREEVVKQHHDFEVVWECEIALLRRDPVVNCFMEGIVFDGPVETANAVFPLRTEVFRYWAESDDKYVIRMRDISSLSGDVMREGEFPRIQLRRLHGDHFTVPIFYPEELRAQVKGIVFCRVLPPRSQLIPILPDRFNDHLVYPLCRVCTEMDALECLHSDELRIITGTWTTFELEVALEQGYVITQVIGAQHWDEWSQYSNEGEKVQHSVFSEYAERLIMMEKLASGFPTDVVTDSEKAAFIEKVKEESGLERWSPNPSKVLKNTARRLMKLPDVFGQLTDQPSTRAMNNPSELWKLLEDHTMLLHEIRIVNGGKLIVSSGKQRKDAKPTVQTVHMVPALVGGQMNARILRAVTHPDGDVLYTDDSSIVYRIRRDKEDPLASLGVPAFGDEISKYHSTGPGHFSIALGEKIVTRSPGFNWSLEKYARQANGGQRQMQAMVEGKPFSMDIKYQSIERNSHFLLHHVDRKYRIHNLLPFSRRSRRDGSTFPIGYKTPYCKS